MSSSLEIKNFGILGYPVSHSFSPKMHRAAFEAANFANYNYIPLEISRDKLYSAVESLKNLNFRGVNVTIPHKTSIIKYLDEIDPDAQVIGAVNTVINYNGVLTGYNTDIIGFLDALVEVKFSIENCHAIILGAGGAARAILWAFCKRHAKQINIGARNLSKARSLADDFKNYGEIFAYDWLSEKFQEIIQSADIIVNTTPLGMFPNIDAMPPINLTRLQNDALVYDIIYTPKETKLLSTARELGLKTLNGLSMLLMQGREAYKLFTGEVPDVKVMAQALEKILQYKND